MGKYEEAISYLDRALEIYLILMSISDNTFYIKQKIQILIVKLCSDGSLSAAPVIMPRPIDFRISGKDNFVWLNIENYLFHLIFLFIPIEYFINYIQKTVKLKEY
jgi:hypothetical protein